jgi:hypothetical protein
MYKYYKFIKFTVLNMSIKRASGDTDLQRGRSVKKTTNSSTILDAPNERNPISVWFNQFQYYTTMKAHADAAEKEYCIHNNAMMVNGIFNCVWCFRELEKCQREHCESRRG